MSHTLRPEAASPAPPSTRVGFALVMLMIVGGCGESPASKPHPAADPMQAPVANSTENPIDFSKWQTLTVERKQITQRQAGECRASYDEAMKSAALGPHWVPLIKVFANSVASNAVASRDQTPLPVGSVIVKEKWVTPGPPSNSESKMEDGRSDTYAAMIKREAGYDPEFGDWEYVYVTLGKDSRVERGHLQNCRECHSQASSTDFLFLPNRESESQP